MLYIREKYITLKIRNFLKKQKKKEILDLFSESATNYSVNLGESNTISLPYFLHPFEK